MTEKVTTMQDAQKLVRDFAKVNGWSDAPNVDKFDHLHEELVEMSKLLRYKTEEERLTALQEYKDEFIDGIGDLFFGLCRLANQLDVDMEEAFNLVKDKIPNKYNGSKSEVKPHRK